MDASLMTRLKDWEDDKSSLKKRYADVRRKTEITQGGSGQKSGKDSQGG